MNETKAPCIVTVGTYPPFEDGISTFTHDLVAAQRKMFEPQIIFKVAAIDITGIKPLDYPSEVEWVIRKNERTDYSMAADAINKLPEVKCVVLQHEYGIFGGVLGEWTGDFILDFLERLKKPVIIICHTVLSNPPAEVIGVTKRLIARADRLVVMSRHSSDTLKKAYGVANDKIQVIQHGIHPTVFEYPEHAKKIEDMEADAFIMATFGFLGPDKGIEYVIESLPAVVKKYPHAQYWLIGRTHPLIQAKSGERYRDELQALVKRLKLENNVKFFSRYQSVPEILKFLSLTDAYVATSLNPEQTVSGTFSYALGSGRCIISTAFAQAKESIVRKNMGVLVDFRSPKAFSDAMIYLIENPRARRRMQLRAYKNTRSMLWTNCAVSFVELCAAVDDSKMIARNRLPALNHAQFKALNDEFGMIQFSKGTVPDRSSGYTIDDTARALLTAAELGAANDPALMQIAETSLNFVSHCQDGYGLFHNDISEDRRKIFLPNTVGVPEDANARTMWVLNTIRADRSLPRAFRTKAGKIADRFEESGHIFKFPRSKAFYLLGLAALAGSDKNPPELLWRHITREADALVAQFHAEATDSWQWFEPTLTYANGVLPAALLESFRIVNRPEYREIGLRSLRFLIDATFRGEVYLPIGQRGWYKRNKRRAEFDQQPEDPFAMIQALAAAYRITNEEYYKHLAYRVFTWFLGNNYLGMPLYDRTTGGCHDGLTKDGTNPNEGAESTMSFLLSRKIMSDMMGKKRE